MAVFLVVGTHAAFATGALAHGYAGMMLARLEIGVPIFFVLSGFLLFRPWFTRPPPTVRPRGSATTRGAGCAG